MSYDENPTYDRLLVHTSRHNIRKWLLKGTYREDAQIIRHAINRLSDRELAKGLARILAGEALGEMTDAQLIRAIKAGCIYTACRYDVDQECCEGRNNFAARMRAALAAAQAGAPSEVRKCASCGTPLSNDCPNCQRLWAS